MWTSATCRAYHCLVDMLAAVDSASATQLATALLISGL